MDKSKASTERGLPKLLKQLQSPDKNYQHHRELEMQYYTHFERALADIYTFEQISDAISTRIYEHEIQGKQISACGLGSIPTLAKTLGDILVRCGRYDEGRDSYRKAISLMKLDRDIHELAYGQSVIALSLLLERQGKRDEAIRELHRVLKNTLPNGFRWQIKARIILLRLLITEDRLNDALKLDPISILKNAKNSGLPRSDIKNLMEISGTLIEKLSQQKRITEAIKLHRAWINSLAKVLDESQRYIDYLWLDFVLTLSDGDTKQIQEASRLVAQLRSRCEQDDLATLRTKTIQALILAKTRSNVAAAILTLKEALDGREMLKNTASELTLGCMSHLSKTLHHQLEECLPLAILKDLFHISQGLTLYDDQFSVICLIVTLSTKGAFQRALNLMEDVLKIRAISFADRLRIRNHMAFMISTEALESENWNQLIRSLQMAKYVWEEARETFGEDPSQKFNVESILASVYSKHAILYRSQEFDDLAIQHEKLSIIRHTSAMQIATETFGIQDARTTLAAEKLAAASVRANFNKAIGIYENIVDFRNQLIEPSADEVLLARRTYARMQEALSSLSSNQSEEFFGAICENQRLLLKSAVNDYGPNHPETLHRTLILAKCYIRLSRYQEAETLLQIAHATWTKVYGARHPGIISLLKDIALNHLRMGRHHLEIISELTALYYLALDVLGGSDIRHPRVLGCRRDLATALMTDRGTRNEGITMMTDVVELQKVVLGGEHRWTVESMRELSRQNVLRDTEVQVAEDV